MGRERGARRERLRPARPRRGRRGDRRAALVPALRPDAARSEAAPQPNTLRRSHHHAPEGQRHEPHPPPTVRPPHHTHRRRQTPRRPVAFTTCAGIAIDTHAARATCTHNPAGCTAAHDAAQDCTETACQHCGRAGANRSKVQKRTRRRVQSEPSPQAAPAQQRRARLRIRHHPATRRHLQRMPGLSALADRSRRRPRGRTRRHPAAVLACRRLPRPRRRRPSERRRGDRAAGRYRTTRKGASVALRGPQAGHILVQVGSETAPPPPSVGGGGGAPTSVGQSRCATTHLAARPHHANDCQSTPSSVNPRLRSLLFRPPLPG